MTDEPEWGKYFDVLSDSLDFEKLSFDYIFHLLAEFARCVLLKDIESGKLEVRDDVRLSGKNLIEKAVLFDGGRLSQEDLAQNRIEAWKLYDSLKGEKTSRDFIRIVVCTLYDEDASELKKYGADDIFEVFFSVLSDLDLKYCAEFCDFVKNKENQVR